MTENEGLLREVEAIDRARESRRARSEARAAKDARRSGRRSARNPRRRTVSIFALFAIASAAGAGLLVWKPTIAGDLSGVGGPRPALEWRHAGTSVYPVRRLEVTPDRVLGVSSPGIVLEADLELSRWRVTEVRTALAVDPAAAVELGPAYRATSEGRVGDVLSGVSVADRGRVIVVGGFLGEGATRDSSTLYYDAGSRLWIRPLTLEADFLHACAFDGPRGYAVGNLGNIVVSTTSGSNWDFTGVVTNADLFDIELCGEGRAVVVGGIDDGPESFGLVLVSDAWGAPFRGVHRTPRPLRAVARSEGGELFFTGDDGTVSASADGGRSWTDLSGEVVFDGRNRPDLLAVAAKRIGGRTMVAAGGRDGEVIFSGDGKSWQTARLPAGAGTVTALTFTAGALFAVTDRAQVFKADIGS